MSTFVHDKTFECNVMEYAGSMLDEFRIKFEDKDYIASPAQNNMFGEDNGKNLEEKMR